LCKAIQPQITLTGSAPKICSLDKYKDEDGIERTKYGVFDDTAWIDQYSSEGSGAIVATGIANWAMAKTFQYQLDSMTRQSEILVNLACSIDSGANNSFGERELTEIECCDENKENNSDECDEKTEVISGQNTTSILPYKTTKHNNIGQIQDVLVILNRQISSIQKSLCIEEESQDCMILMPDQSLYYQAGKFLTFLWVLESNPKTSVYATTSQLRNPLEIFQTENDNSDTFWDTYFNNIYKIIGKQWATYWAKDSNQEPLVKGWFSNKEEAKRYFEQLKTLTTSEVNEENNPRFNDIENSTMQLSNDNKKLILYKVCYAEKDSMTDKLKKKHGWKNPYL